MARALFHKGQRVYVKPVGTWSLVERVVPQWVKGVEEPLRVTYEVGLGREFAGNELVSEAAMRGPENRTEEVALDNWRVFRFKNRWQQSEAATAAHPYPGTFPVVMTDDLDWGGWRVPGAEYDRDPNRIEFQARVIVNGPDMLRIVRALTDYLAREGDKAPDALKPLGRKCARVLRHVYEIEAASEAVAGRIATSETVE
jgi:hypothetical protein